MLFIIDFISEYQNTDQDSSRSFKKAQNISVCILKKVCYSWNNKVAFKLKSSYFKSNNIGLFKQINLTSVIIQFPTDPYKINKNIYTFENVLQIFNLPLAKQVSGISIR